MNSRDRIIIGLVLIARNPATLIVLIPALLFCVPLALVFGFFYVLIKVLEKAQYAQRKRAQALPPIMLAKEPKC